jgi:hypothetical protein
MAVLATPEAALDASLREPRVLAAAAVLTGGLVAFNGEQPAVELSPSRDFIRRDIFPPPWACCPAVRANRGETAPCAWVLRAWRRRARSGWCRTRGRPSRALATTPGGGRRVVVPVVLPALGARGYVFEK